MSMRTSSVVLFLDAFGLAVLAQLQDDESMNFKCQVGAATNLPDIVDNAGEEGNDRRNERDDRGNGFYHPNSELGKAR
jgi:hypothetical protein